MSDKWVSGTIELKIGGAEIEMQMTIPAGKIHPRRLLPIFRQMTDSFVEIGFQDAVSEGKQISCKAGCGACCRQLVPISETEARELADFVSHLPPVEQTKARARFAEAIEKLKAAGLLEKLREPERFSDETFVETGMKYFAVGVPCPFLENESCSIHPIRPLICREYLVTTPAANCTAPTRDNIRRVPIPAKTANALISLNKFKTEGARFAPFVPLVLLLEFAANTPDEMPLEDGQILLKKVIANLRQ
jgi:Fe-S-cluster containining protein